MDYDEREDFREAVDALLTQAEESFWSCNHDSTRRHIITLLKSLELQAGEMFRRFNDHQKREARRATALEAQELRERLRQIEAKL